MKRIAAVCLAAMILFLCAGPGLAAPAASTAAVTIDGIRTAFFGEDGRYLLPLEENGVLYVPAVPLAESLGLSVTADAETLAVWMNGVRMAFFGPDGAYVPPFVSDGTVYVPLLAFAESAGIRAEADGNRYALLTGRMQQTQPEPAATAQPLPETYWLKLTDDNFNKYFSVSLSATDNLVQKIWTADGTITVTMTCTALTGYTFRNARFSVNAEIAGTGTGLTGQYIVFSGIVMPQSGFLTQTKSTRVKDIDLTSYRLGGVFTTVGGISGEIGIPRAEAQAMYDEADSTDREGRTDSAIKLFTPLAEMGFGDAAERIEALKARKEEETRAAQYDDAVRALNAGKYEDAISRFEELARLGYRDSAEKLQAAKEALNEQKYQAALDLFQKGEHAKAANAFKALNGYKDSVEQMELAQEALNEQNYQDALVLFQKGEYEKAVSAFKTLHGYRDSDAQAELAKEALNEQKYQAALDLFQKGEYAKAGNAFKALNGYKDSVEQMELAQEALNEQNYQDALVLFQKGEYEKAVSAFKTLHGYRDSDAQAELAQEALNGQKYHAALDLYRTGRWDEAIRAFEALSGYSDSAARAQEVRTWKTEHVRQVKGFRATDIGGFHHSLAAVKYTNGKWGFMNTEGKLVIPCRYDEVGDFSSGYAPVAIGTGDSRKVGLIDPKGERIIPLGQYEDVGSFSDGLCRVRLNGKYGFVDTTGKLVISCIYEDANYFTEGLAMVKKGALWGAIDTKGKTVLKPQYKEFAPFREGVAVIKEGDDHWYIDTDGNKLFGRSFKKASSFRDGLALCSEKYDQENKAWIYQYIDHTGKPVIRFDDPEYRKLYDFYNGYAVINRGGLLAVIDHTGRKTVPVKYYSLNYSIVTEVGPAVYYGARKEKDGKWGIIDAHDHVIEPFEYDKVRHYHDGYAIGLKEETVYILSLPEY